jgi:hypothetical protein
MWKSGRPQTTSTTTSLTPWPQLTPIHRAAKDGVPVLVKQGGHAFRVLKPVTTYEVNKLGERRVGTAWKLQLDDYRRIVVFHSESHGWLLAR